MNMWHIPSLNTPFIASSKRGFSRSLFLTSSPDTDCFLTVPTLRRFLSLRSIWYDENEKVFIVPTLRRRWRDSTASAPELSGPHAGTYFFLHQPLGPYRPSTHLELSGDDWGGDTPPRPGIRERERESVLFLHVSFLPQFHCIMQKIRAEQSALQTQNMYAVAVRDNRTGNDCIRKSLNKLLQNRNLPMIPNITSEQGRHQPPNNSTPKL